MLTLTWEPDGLGGETFALGLTPHIKLVGGYVPQGNIADCWADLLVTGLDTLQQHGTRVVQTTAPTLVARAILRNHVANFVRQIQQGAATALVGGVANDHR